MGPLEQKSEEVIQKPKIKKSNIFRTTFGRFKKSTAKIERRETRYFKPASATTAWDAMIIKSYVSSNADHGEDWTDISTVLKEDTYKAATRKISL